MENKSSKSGTCANSEVQETLPSVETPLGNGEEPKNKQPLPKKQSSTKPPSNVERNRDSTLTTAKQKESVNEIAITANTTSQSSPATQPSANRNSVSAASTSSICSQNPEFLVRNCNFLLKGHLASYTKTEEHNSAMQRAPLRKSEHSANNGANVGGAASCSGSSNPPALAQQQNKKQRTTVQDSSGAQVSPIVISPTPVADISVDQFCWVCHKQGVTINCVSCPRGYHLLCVQLETAPTVDWVCPECSTDLQAENFDTRIIM